MTVHFNARGWVGSNSKTGFECQCNKLYPTKHQPFSVGSLPLLSYDGKTRCCKKNIYIFSEKIIISVSYAEKAVGEGIGKAICKYGNINVIERTLVSFQLKYVKHIIH